MKEIINKNIIDQTIIEKENLAEIYCLELLRDDTDSIDFVLLSNKLSMDSDCVKQKMEEIKKLFDNNLDDVEIYIVKRKKYIKNVSCIDLCVFKRLPIVELKKCIVCEKDKTTTEYLKFENNEYFDANGNNKTQYVKESEFITRIEK